MNYYFELWHIINGKWVHIVQEVIGDKVLYYTDGMSDAFRRMSDFNRELVEKNATRLISPMKASNLVKNARPFPTKKEQKEIAYKY